MIRLWAAQPERIQPLSNTLLLTPCQFSSKINDFLCHSCSLNITSLIQFQGMLLLFYLEDFPPDPCMGDCFLSLRSYYLLREDFTEQPELSGTLHYFKSLNSILLSDILCSFPLSISKNVSSLRTVFLSDSRIVPDVEHIQYVLIKIEYCYQVLVGYFRYDMKLGLLVEQSANKKTYSFSR